MWKILIAIVSVVLPVAMTNYQTKVIGNFKFMRITATQMIAHYSVNFDQIQNSSKRLSL